MANRAQPPWPNPQSLGRMRALRFTGNTDADVLRSIADWESSLEYSRSILVITFESHEIQQDYGESAIVYYEDV